MNWEHFRAFLWLRWRLRVNQMKRGGTANAVVLAILVVCGAVLAVGLFFIGLLVGLEVLAGVSPAVLLYTWDGLVLAFLFIWAITLLADLQRAEVLSLDKFLHLPVSLTGAFLINYLSSLVNFPMILFVPAAVGLTLGLAVARGLALLLALPLVAAFLLMVTALTHQFQGWLASLMTNQRRRRTVIVFVTIGFVLLVQVPNFVMQTVVSRDMKSAKPGASDRIREQSKEFQRRSEEISALLKEQGELALASASGRDTRERSKRRFEEVTSKLNALLETQKRDNEESKRTLEQTKLAFGERWQRAEQTARIVNLALPPGWLPLGAADAAADRVLPALLGTAGLALIGAASLRRSYRTTIRLYTGQFTAGGRKSAAAVAPAAVAPAAAGGAKTRLLERQLPWLSDQTAAIALAGFRSLTRAPEAKMMLLSPVLMVLVFGWMLMAQSGTMPAPLRPVLVTGAMAWILLSTVGLLGNQFGFDRSGFRVFVLCGAPRRDILLGKNLAFAPYTLGLGAASAVVLECVYPMRVDHFLATLPQLVSMYLMFCLLANLLSMLAPLAIAPGAMRPVNIKVVPLALHLAFMFLFPPTLALTLLPLAIEYALRALGLASAVPVYLLLSLAGCTAVVFFYRVALDWEGKLLQHREKRILEIVTTKTE